MAKACKLFIVTALVSWLVTAVVYLFYLPLLEMVRMTQRLEGREGVEFNQFFHMRDLATDEDREVVRPNNDTLYSSAGVDMNLSGPLLLTIPDTGDRYYSFQFIDLDTDVFRVIGRRSDGNSAAQYLIVGPDWQGQAPSGVEVVRGPRNRLWLLGRTLVDGPEDLPAVHALQDQYLLEPYSP